MKKSWIWISGVALLILIIIGFFVIRYINEKNSYFNSPEFNTPTAISPILQRVNDCPENPTDFKFREVNCITSIAMEYKNTSICYYAGDGIGSSGLSYREECISQTNERN